VDKSDITAELIPVSHTLSQVATIGLSALEDLQNHRAANSGTLWQKLALLKDAAKPQAVLLNKVVPSAELLVQATGNH
jgi:hexosaminidase